jgi:hypothetical protein
MEPSFVKEILFSLCCEGGREYSALVMSPNQVYANQYPNETAFESVTQL